MKTTVIIITLLGSETSQYQKIQKIKRDSESSGERNRTKNNKNKNAKIDCTRTIRVAIPLKNLTKEGKSPVSAFFCLLVKQSK